MVTLTSIEIYGSTYYRDRLRDIFALSFPLLSFVCLTTSPQWLKVTETVCVMTTFCVNYRKSIVPVSIHSVNERLPNNTSPIYKYFTIVVSQ